MGFDDEGSNNTGGAAGAGIITAAAGLYDSWRNRVQSKENTDKTIAAQKSESELAYQRSVQSWNEQNLYNSPQAQMQRFQEAGLNPHLIYGQGSSGLASSPPQYQPANLQYRYEAPAYGSAIQSVIPMLMSVGTWMQNMRASEVGIDKGTTEIERARQLIDYLEKQNPQLLEEKSNRLSLFPYQAQMLGSQTEKARVGLHEAAAEFRYKYGDDLWRSAGGPGSDLPISGVKRLQFLQEHSKQKLLEAKSSWSDMNITDPQAIMQMVFQGVMGLAGQQLRLNTKARTLPQKRERPRGLSFNRMSRNHPDRR